jgi:hypothetical protein
MNEEFGRTSRYPGADRLFWLLNHKVHFKFEVAHRRKLCAGLYRCEFRRLSERPGGWAHESTINDIYLHEFYESVEARESFFKRFP